VSVGHYLFDSGGELGAFQIPESQHRSGSGSICWTYTSPNLASVGEFGYPRDSRNQSRGLLESVGVAKIWANAPHSCSVGQIG
jgi:hypothetical protein